MSSAPAITPPQSAAGSGSFPLNHAAASHRELERGAGAERRKFVAEGVTLFLADNRDVRDLLAADALVSDPPYGMDWDTDSTRFTGGQHKRGKGRKDWGNIAHDAEPFDPAPWLEYPRCVLWGANHYAARLPVGTTLVWLKKVDHLFGTFLSDAELGWMKGGHGVYAYRKQFPPPSRMAENAGKVAHPTQKPIGLMAWAMDRAKVPPGALVCDPYAGSGTTAIACLRTGRRFVGCEKDPEHFATAVARIRRELSQPELFGVWVGGETVAGTTPEEMSAPRSATPEVKP